MRSQLLPKLKEHQVSLFGSGGGTFKMFLRCIFSSNMRAVLLHEIAGRLYAADYLALSKIFVKLNKGLCHICFEPGAKIGVGLKLPHCVGIVIGGKSVIGNNCKIYQNVTIGGNYGKKTNDGVSQPIIGDRVAIGPGAVVLGPVKIGNDSIIGANAVVIEDVTEKSVVGGVPAKPIVRRL